jgi:hypothetical protein
VKSFHGPLISGQHAERYLPAFDRLLGQPLHCFHNAENLVIEGTTKWQVALDNALFRGNTVSVWGHVARIG